jgi:hypothetical protein
MQSAGVAHVAGETEENMISGGMCGESYNMCLRACFAVAIWPRIKSESFRLPQFTPNLKRYAKHMIFIRKIPPRANIQILRAA